MKVKTITVSCDVKLSEQFQSVGLARSVEFSLDAGEKESEAIEKVNKYLSKSVLRDCRAALNVVLYGEPKTPAVPGAAQEGAAQ